MDFSGFIIIPLAALITAGWIIAASIISKRGPGFRRPFWLSYALGIIFMEPWKISSWEHGSMFALMLVFLVLWVAAGCLLGGLPAAVIVSVAGKLRHRFKQ